MSLLEKLNKQFIAARLGKEAKLQEKNLLMTFKGQVDTVLKEVPNYSVAQSDAAVSAAAKSLIKGLNSLIVDGASEATLASLNYEIAILEDYLPKFLSKEEILQILEPLNLSEVTDVNKRMGMAMGKLKGQVVDGTEVRRIVENEY